MNFFKKISLMSKVKWKALQKPQLKMLQKIRLKQRVQHKPLSVSWVDGCFKDTIVQIIFM